MGRMFSALRGNWIGGGGPAEDYHKAVTLVFGEGLGQYPSKESQAPSHLLSPTECVFDRKELCFSLESARDTERSARATSSET
eukprot:268680-Amphidinium_carterae.1